MNKIIKLVLKIMVVCVSCIGIHTVYTRMPKAVGAIYSSIFETYHFFFVIFIVGCVVVELLFFSYIRKNDWYSAKRVSYCFTIILATTVSIILLATNNTSLYEKIEPNADATLIRSIAENYDTNTPNPMVKAVILEYYFRDKQVVLAEGIDESSNDIKYIKELVLPATSIQYVQKIEISSDTSDDIIQNPHYQSGEFVFVIDKYWNQASEIVLVFSENQGYFVSHELVNDIQSKQELEPVTNTGAQIDNLFQYLADQNEENGEGHVWQILILLGLLFIGLVFTLAFWGNKYPALAFSMGLPAGAAVWCIIGIIYIILNIPYNLLTMGCGIGFIALFTIYKLHIAYKRIDWNAIFNMLLVSIIITVIFTYSEITYLSYDSNVRAIFGQRLAEVGSLKDIFAWVAPYGVLDPIILSIGYLVGIDMLYAFYPLIAISGIAIMVTALYYRYVNNKEKLVISMLVLAFGIILLFTNLDYLLSCFYIMAHGSTAVYTLIMIVFFVMKKECNIKYAEYAIVLAANIILMTRIEGAVYVLLFWAAMLGFDKEYLFVKKVGIWGSVHIILWNVIQILIIGNSGSPVFWTPQRGVLLIIVSMAFIITLLVMGRQWKWISWIKKYFFVLLISAIIGITVLGSIYMRTMASSNFPVYLAHFSNGVLEDTNAAAVWSFILLLCPMLLLADKQKDAEFALAIIWGYVMIIYCICLFRDGYPLKLKLGDSARRTIVQIMPTAIWMVANFYELCVSNAKRLCSDNAIRSKEEEVIE